ncbi:MAG: peptide transporter [bacterium]|nr:peptide transporter [bacterium]MCM1423780.1 peptide transporter [bacterium]
MRNLVTLSSLEKEDVFEIFRTADELQEGRFQNFFQGKSIVLFFPNTSIRTRVTFERGIYLLGGQPILFPLETLDKKEKLEDVCGYLNLWADEIIVRHGNMDVVRKLAQYSDIPVINAMTDKNHPCEILSDLYSLSKIRADFTKDKYLFCGRSGNIGLSWKEAADILGFELSQCCPTGYEMENIPVVRDIKEAVKGKDIICTDSLPADTRGDFEQYQIAKEIMEMANDNAILNPCPPFYRGEEVSEDVITSDYFVGYQFKRYLLEVQQAIMIYCLKNE